MRVRSRQRDELVQYALGEERLLDVFVAEAAGEIIGHVMACRSFDVQSGRLADLYFAAR